MNEVDNEVVNEVANSTLSENTDVILNEITIVPDKVDSAIEEPATSEGGLPLAESEPEDAAPVASLPAEVAEESDALEEETAPALESVALEAAPLKETDPALEPVALEVAPAPEEASETPRSVAPLGSVAPVAAKRSEKKLQVAIHAVSNDADSLVKVVKFLDAPFHILVATPNSRDHIPAALAELSRLNRWYKVFVLDDDFDVGKMSAQLSAFLASETTVEDGEIVVNASAASRFLWKAMELATMRFKSAPQVFFDWKKDRCQVSRDGVNWHAFPLRSSALVGGVPAPQIVNLVPAVEKNVSTEERPDDQFGSSFSASESIEVGEEWSLVESDEYAVIDGALELSALEISASEVPAAGKTTPSKSRRAILDDQELCNRLWEFRKVITHPRAWSNKDRQKQCAHTLTFQDVARAFVPPTQVRVQGDDDAKDLRLVFHAKNEPYQIVFYKHKEGGGTTNTLTFKDWTLQEIRRFLGGAWFEEYIYQQADELARTIKNPPEVKLNVRMSDREIDVVVAASKKVYLLECKTGHVDLDDVKRLEQLVKQHAETKGIETLGILVSLKPIPTDGVVEKYIKSSACLACFYGDNIPTRMKNLLTTQPKCVLR